MKVSDIIIKCLEREGTKLVFGYPGGAVLPLYESLRTSNIKHVLVRQEQAAAHSASGYARVSGQVGVCIATSGPGAINLMTGIATAYMDSIPLVAITGQVQSSTIGKDVFQEVDIVGATEPFTKYNYLVKDASSIPRIIKEAFYIASTGRPGPVLIDIPVDIQEQNVIDFEYPSEVEIRGYNPTYKGHIGQIKRAVSKIKTSKRPLVCAGGGVISAKASEELRIFSEKTNIPVVHTMMGIGGLPTDSKRYVGMIGFHGHRYSNEIINEADLLIIIGARIADRSIICDKITEKGISVIHIDVDPAEIGKNMDVSIPVVGDAKEILKELIERLGILEIDDWIKDIEAIKNRYRQNNDYVKDVNPVEVLEVLSTIVDEKAILTADVGKNQIWAAKNFGIKGERKFLTSGGLGTMGYSVPAAVGAKFAAPNKTVISVVGDGGIQMLLGELGTVSENNLDIIILLFNNNRLGMVKELQDKSRGKYKNFGVEFGVTPDFVKIAEAYGISGRRIDSNDELENVLADALKSKKPYLIECLVDPNLNSV